MGITNIFDDFCRIKHKTEWNLKLIIYVCLPVFWLRWSWRLLSSLAWRIFPSPKRWLNPLLKGIVETSLKALQNQTWKKNKTERHIFILMKSIFFLFLFFSEATLCVFICALREGGVLDKLFLYLCWLVTLWTRFVGVFLEIYKHLNRFCFLFEFMV